MNLNPDDDDDDGDDDDDDDDGGGGGGGGEGRTEGKEERTSILIHPNSRSPAPVARILIILPGGRGCFSDTSLQPFVRLGGPVAQWPLLV